jgi:hypothetical protein
MLKPTAAFFTLLALVAPVAAETIFIHAGPVITDASNLARGPSATTNAAPLLGPENQVGRIAPGYSADMIAVDGDPLSDVRVLEKVEFVMVRGRVIE